ncbi:MAG: NAD(P)H-hydrate dehydratase [Clostridium sp.]|nr:NAD(P)H-hydrate dehydratase [Clostridium sp.]
MKYVLKAGEMKACDGYTIRKIGILSMVLMERAALSVVCALEKKGALKKARRVLIAAGTGNNGGDGLAIGRLLSQRGIEVTFYLEGNQEKLSQETRAQMEIVKNLGFPIRSKLEDAEYDMVVDALFGIGLSREISGNYREAIEKINDWGKHGAFICSVDIPSGICADTGRVYGCAVRANLTVTFAFAKWGHFLYPGKDYAGEVVVTDIGIPEKALETGGASGFYYRKEMLRELLPARCPWGNKGTFGKVLLLAGSRNMCGACILCGRGVLRAGAGMVKIITPPCNREIVQQSLPEALLGTWDELFSGRKEAALGKTLERDVAKVVEQDLAWADVIVAGPGMGTDERAYLLLKQVLERTTCPMVLDADGLNLLAIHKDLWELAENRKGGLALTPHPGELIRLLETDMETYRGEREKLVLTLAEKLNAVVIGKDAATLVAEGGRREIYLNTSGNDGMAAAGSGDVLAGIVGGLLAQGMSYFEGACLGAYLHGLAGDLACRKKGAYGMIAGDICEALAKITRGRK